MRNYTNYSVWMNPAGNFEVAVVRQDPNLPVHCLPGYMQFFGKGTLRRITIPPLICIGTQGSEHLESSWVQGGILESANRYDRKFRRQGMTILSDFGFSS